MDALGDPWTDESVESLYASYYEEKAQEVSAQSGVPIKLFLKNSHQNTHVLDFPYALSSHSSQYEKTDHDDGHVHEIKLESSDEDSPSASDPSRPHETSDDTDVSPESQNVSASIHETTSLSSDPSRHSPAQIAPLRRSPRNLTKVTRFRLTAPRPPASASASQSASALAPAPQSSSSSSSPSS